MEQSCFVILFNDGSYFIWAHKPLSQHFQKGSRLFETSEDTSMLDFCEWLAHRFNTHKFKEVKDW